MKLWSLRLRPGCSLGFLKLSGGLVASLSCSLNYRIISILLSMMLPNWIFWHRHVSFSFWWEIPTQSKLSKRLKWEAREPLALIGEKSLYEFLMQFVHVLKIDLFKKIFGIEWILYIIPFRACIKTILYASNIISHSLYLMTIIIFGL